MSTDAGRKTAEQPPDQPPGKEDFKRNIYLIITMVLMSIYLIWRAFFTLPFGVGVWNVVGGLLLLIAEIITVWTTFELFIQKMQKRNTWLPLPQIPDHEYPHVDVFIATHNEPVDLLYKTVNGCVNMRYPDPTKVHIFLCDDGNRPEVAELAESFGVGYLGLADNEHAKSGNLNNGLANSTSPLIATFDADMIPRSTFLLKTVPYFAYRDYVLDDGIWRRREEDEECEFRMGLVQTPQSFYNPDLFQFNLHAEGHIPNEQDFFSREINVLRNISGAVAYTGSNALLSREAIDEIGGFPYHTITEDFEASVRMQKSDFKVYATDEVQSAGLSTTTVGSMIKQRVRWARGIIQSIWNTNAIFTSKLPFKSRLTYLNSYLYWWSFWNRFVFIMAPLVFALWDFQIVNATFIQLGVFWLPAYFFYSTSMRYLSSNVRNQRWSQVIDTIFMPYLIVPVILETFRIRAREFKVTNKTKSDRANRDFWYAVPHIIILILSILALIRFTAGKYGAEIFYGSIIIFWLAYNIIALLYALFFMLGRRSLRKAERIAAKEEVEIRHLGYTYHGTTEDLSDNGIAFTTSRAIPLPDNETFEVQILAEEKGSPTLDCQLAFVSETAEGWRYSARVTPREDQDRREYSQIIYDRPHSLPVEMNPWITAYDDIVRNLTKRATKPVSHQRRAPRVPLNATISFVEGGSCRVHDCNFRYFSASNFVGVPDDAATLTITTKSGRLVHLTRTGTRAAIANRELLVIQNAEELVRDGVLQQLIDDLGAAAPERA